MKILYLDVFSGISGDMLLGALINLGVPVNKLKQTLSSLEIQFDIRAHKERRVVSGINVEVVTRDKQGRKAEDIIQLIGNTGLDEWVKRKSIEVFKKIGDVEAKIHGVRNAHLHEIGMVDSIVDIVGVITAVKHLGIERIYCSPIPLGRGFVVTQHGPLPVPAPATIELVRGMPVYFTPIETEIVTPTGAGLLSVLVDDFSYPSFIVDKVGYGMGKRELPQLNALRVISGVLEEETREDIWEIEANIDNYNPEFHEYIIGSLLSLGAVDATITPTLMKKGRLGIVLKALSPRQHLDKIQDAFFCETSTLGIRIKKINRIILPRRMLLVATPYGTVNVKIATWKGKVVTISPEYEDCKKIAREKNVPLKLVHEEAKKETEKNIGNKGFH